MFTLAFWKAATERAVKTAAQTVLTTYFVGDVALNALHADWENMSGIAAGGLVASYLFSLASGVKDGNPSATNSEPVKSTFKLQEVRRNGATHVRVVHDGTVLSSVSVADEDIKGKHEA